MKTFTLGTKSTAFRGGSEINAFALMSDRCSISGKLFPYVPANDLSRLVVFLETYHLLRFPTLNNRLE